MRDEEFKVGDECFINSGYGSGTLTAVKIIKITPSGQIVVDRSQTRFRASGSAIGGDTWSRSHLYHHLPHLVRQYSEQKLKYYIEHLVVKKMTDEEISTVTKIFIECNLREKASGGDE